MRAWSLQLLIVMGLTGIVPVKPILPQCVATTMVVSDTLAHPDSAGAISLRFDGIHFLTDDEYFGNRIEGYTLPGFRLTPKAVWQLGDRVQIQGGVSWLHYWGAHGYPANATYGVLPTYSDTTSSVHLLPWMQARIWLSPRAVLTLGSLDPTDHRLPLPLFNPERLYAADPEQGLEVQTSLSWVDVDAWIDWRQFIWNLSPQQERFTMGASARLRIPVGGGELYMPLHFVAQHVGGQVLAVTTPIQNNFNGAVGLGATCNASGNTSFDLSLRAMWYHQHGTRAVPFGHGWGLYPELTAVLRPHWNFAVSYWTGRGFVPLMGSWLFSNLSSVDPTLSFARTDVATTRLSYILSPRQAPCQLRADVAFYYYPLEQQLQFSVGCSFTFSPSIRIR